MLSLALIIIFLIMLFLRGKLPARLYGYLPYGVAILSVVLKVSFLATWENLSPSLLLIFLLSLNDKKLKNEMVLYPLVFVAILPNTETLFPLLIVFSFILINYLTRLKSVSLVSGLVVLGLCLLLPYSDFRGEYSFILLLPLILLILSFNEVSQILIICFVMSQKFFLDGYPDMAFSVCLIILLSLFKARKIGYSITPPLILASWSPVDNRIMFFIVAVLSIDTMSKVARVLFDSIHSLEVSEDGKFLISKEHGLLLLLVAWVFSGTKFSLGSYSYFLEVSEIWRNLAALAILASVVFFPILRSNTYLKESDVKPLLIELFLKSTVLAIIMSFILDPGLFAWGQFLGGVLLVGTCVLIKIEKLNFGKINTILCKNFLSVPQINSRSEVFRESYNTSEVRSPVLPKSKYRGLGLEGLGPTFIFVLMTLLTLIVYIEN